MLTASFLLSLQVVEAVTIKGTWPLLGDMVSLQLSCDEGAGGGGGGGGSVVTVTSWDAEPVFPLESVPVRTTWNLPALV
jgi:hypothetical protein